MKLISQFFSGVLHPLLMPLYGTILILTYSYLAIYPTMYKVLIACSVFFFTAIIPALSIVWLYKTGRTKTIQLNDREDRPIPYLICLSSYLLCGIFMYKLSLPLWSIAFTIGALLSVVVNICINTWWKISAHQAGMGGAVAIGVVLQQLPMAFVPSWLAPLLILLTGALGTSRIYLDRHTFMQVICGTANGFLCVYYSIQLALLFS